MSTWGTQDLAKALPAATLNPNASAECAVADPRTHGWAKPEAYDYGKYNMSTKEYQDQQLAAFEAAAAENQGLPSGLHSGESWAGNAPIYEWKGEYGDVGPRFPDIEAMLFGNEEADTGVIDFQKYGSLSSLFHTSRPRIH